ncbi:MAG: hypothetical protein ABI543_01660 [Ignavibacteria bacterium]
MKRIGILFGQENTFPQAFIDRVNHKAREMNVEIIAEPVVIDKVIQGEPMKYHVIIDRISQDVPFYRAYLKNAASSGTAVINNPFWWSADEKFFNNALMTKIGVPVPKTVILPSNQLPTDTTQNSFRNLSFPLDWEGIFSYIGFPAYFKPHSGGGWKSVYKCSNPEELFKNYNETEQLVMMLQEEIIFDEYYRIYCLDRQDVWVMPYEPRNPHHLRYLKDTKVDPERNRMLTEVVLKINRALGYDFNTVELALRDGIPYAIDFCNPAPDADVNSVGEANFEWIVEAAANMAIRRAMNHREGLNNLTWGDFVYASANNDPIVEGAYDNSVKKKPENKLSTKKPAKKAKEKVSEDGDEVKTEKKSKKTKAA